MPEQPKHELTKKLAMAMLYDCTAATIRVLLDEVDEIIDERNKLKEYDDARKYQLHERD